MGVNSIKYNEGSNKRDACGYRVAVQNDECKATSCWSKEEVCAAAKFSIHAVDRTENKNKNKTANPFEWRQDKADDFANGLGDAKECGEQPDGCTKCNLGDARRNRSILVYLRRCTAGKYSRSASSGGVTKMSLRNC